MRSKAVPLGWPPSDFLPLPLPMTSQRSQQGPTTPTASDGTLIAFVRPQRPVKGFRIVGAHTDSPNLRLKPRAVYEKVGYLQLGVEVYGGALLNSWLDRDLLLSGRVMVREENGQLSTRLVSLPRPVVRIPQLAIHLDREVNEKGLLLNRQEHLLPCSGWPIRRIRAAAGTASS
jgi:aspartyl aminopeptidase